MVLAGVPLGIVLPEVVVVLCGEVPTVVCVPTDVGVPTEVDVPTLPDVVPVVPGVAVVVVPVVVPAAPVGLPIVPVLPVVCAKIQHEASRTVASRRSFGVRM